MATLSLDVYTSPERAVPSGGTFSPATATIVAGPTHAVLIDTGYTQEDVEEIARRIDASSRELTTIYITHAHADHYFGLGWLLERFPNARGVAAAAVTAEITSTIDATRAHWAKWFAGSALDNSAIPEPLGTDVIDLDGEQLHVINVGQGDIANNTILYIPSIAAVIAGDVVYNGINPFLAASGPAEWPRWIESIDTLAALEPRIVVAGHKRPDLPDDDPAASIQGTRDYIQRFTEGVAVSENSRQLVARMQEHFPDHGNPSALLNSAISAFKRKQQSHA